MKLVIQRVSSASVTIDGTVRGEIEKGYMVLVGVGKGDTKKDAEKLADKMLKLRIFEDENGKMNKSIADVGGELLVISQFTLYADSRKGNRPSFTDAELPTEAEALYEYFMELCRERGMVVEKGEFGAYMKVALVNDGPVTIILECEDGNILGRGARNDA